MRSSAPTLSVVLGFFTAAIAVSGANAWLQSGDDPAPPKEVKVDRKADHPTAAALRSQIMAEFHGRTTNVFTSVPGFGFERIRPVYERIPWEVPEFSTNEVEVETAPATPQLLKDVFAKSLDAFKKSSQAKAAPTTPPPAQTKGPPLAVTEKSQPGFGATRNGTVVSGLQLRLLDLVGTINADGPKAYSGGKAFELVRSKRGDFGGGLGFGGGFGKPVESEVPAKKEAEGHLSGLEERPLDVFETAGLAELSNGKDTFVRTKGNVIRMLGALRAGDQCLNCHFEHHKGDLLGALSYTFVDTHRTLKFDESKERR
jgi:hypothetical protein